MRARECQQLVVTGRRPGQVARSGLSVLAVVALVALFLTTGIPTRRPATDSGAVLIPPDD